MNPEHHDDGDNDGVDDDDDFKQLACMDLLQLCFSYLY
jgi:hypothetical protein